MSTDLITPLDLDRLLRSGAPVHLLDVRWTLAVPDGRPAYRAGHLPGAVYVDLDTELAGAPSPAEGRHPLPTVEDLQSAARRWGLRRGATVVVYDDVAGQSAARAWWLLRWAGLTDVRVLDGGLSSWVGAGLDLSTEEVSPAPGDVVLSTGQLPTWDADRTADAASSPEELVLDARAAERYRGEVEPIDPRPGHIPGAVSAPTVDNIDPDGRLLSPTELTARFTALGAVPDRPVGVYCGSGVTAAHQALALTVAGFIPVLFPGSWSAWSADPARPAALGPDPLPLTEESLR